jgi:hypothetical protein
MASALHPYIMPSASGDHALGLGHRQPAPSGTGAQIEVFSEQA